MIEPYYLHWQFLFTFSPTSHLTNLLVPLPSSPLQTNLQVYLSQRGQAAVDSNHVERLERAVASYRTQVQQLKQEKMALEKDAKVQYRTNTSNSCRLVNMFT